jgi:hypothetical protein
MLPWTSENIYGSVCGIVGLIGAIFEERAYWRRITDHCKNHPGEPMDLLK